MIFSLSSPRRMPSGAISPSARSPRTRAWRLGRLGLAARASTSRLAALACSLAMATASAQASERRDHDRVREAVQAGEVMPLPALLERLQRTHPGQVLEVELEREQGRWVFEVRLLQPGGRLLKLELDARSGELLSSKARDRREAAGVRDAARESSRTPSASAPAPSR